MGYTYEHTSETLTRRVCTVYLKKGDEKM